MAFLIRPDGTREEMPSPLRWNDIKEAIGGGFVQEVSCDPDVAHGCDVFYCDEEGKLKSFPPNPEATKLSTFTMHNDVLVGTIVFAKADELVDE